MILILLIACGAPVILYGFLRWSLWGKTFEMDFMGAGSFLHLYHAYSRGFWAIFIAGLVGSYLLIGWGAWAAVFLLLFAAISALLFNLTLVFYYESFCHARYRPDGVSNYSGLKYATALTLGISSVWLFCIGMGVVLLELWLKG